MKVAAVKVDSYNYLEVEQGLREALAIIGGMAGLVNPGEKVLLKPNMLEGLPPEKAVTTNPYVVHEVLFSKEALSSASEQNGVFQ